MSPAWIQKTFRTRTRKYKRNGAGCSNNVVSHANSNPGGTGESQSDGWNTGNLPLSKWLMCWCVFPSQKKKQRIKKHTHTLEGLGQSRSICFPFHSFFFLFFFTLFFLMTHVATPTCNTTQRGGLSRGGGLIVKERAAVTILATWRWSRMPSSFSHCCRSALNKRLYTDNVTFNSKCFTRHLTYIYTYICQILWSLLAKWRKG